MTPIPGSQVSENLPPRNEGMTSTSIATSTAQLSSNSRQGGGNESHGERGSSPRSTRYRFDCLVRGLNASVPWNSMKSYPGNGDRVDCKRRREKGSPCAVHVPPGTFFFHATASPRKLRHSLVEHDGVRRRGQSRSGTINLCDRTRRRRARARAGFDARPRVEILSKNGRRKGRAGERPGST